MEDNEKHEPQVEMCPFCEYELAYEDEQDYDYCPRCMRYFDEQGNCMGNLRDYEPDYEQGK